MRGFLRPKAVVGQHKRRKRIQRLAKGEMVAFGISASNIRYETVNVPRSDDEASKRRMCPVDKRRFRSRSFARHDKPRSFLKYDIACGQSHERHVVERPQREYPKRCITWSRLSSWHYLSSLISVPLSFEDYGIQSYSKAARRKYRSRRGQLG